MRKLNEEESRVQTALAEEMFLEHRDDCPLRICSDVHRYQRLLPI